MTDILLRSTIILLFTLGVSQAARHAAASLRHLLWLSGLLAAAWLPLAFAILPKLDLPLLPPPPIAALQASSIEIIQPPMSAIVSKPSRWFESAWFWLRLHGITALWAAGFALVFLRFILALTAVRRLLCGSELLNGPEWQDTLQNLRSRFSIARPVQLLAGIGSFAPMVWGIVRPTILLPAETTGWSEERRRFVLAHELAHVKRCDAFAQFVSQIVSAVYWFNPLIWLAASQMRMERERACDDRVISLGMNPHDYARHLVEIARSVGPELRLSPVSMSITHPSQLEKRVNSIVDKQTNRSALTRPAVVAVLGTTTALTIFLGAARLTALPAPAPTLPQAAPPAQSAPRVLETAAAATPVLQRSAELKTEQSTPHTAFQKWLDEDVAYIITGDEKQAFLSLGTDAEREHFIEQFWLRRDPTPGTPENEFKEENYRRISYANERFSYDNIPGWQSDRGHIYIVHGKPDEIESHPSGGTYNRPAEEGGGTINTYPFELWTYRYIEGAGNNVRMEFVDRNGTGDYRLTMDPAAKSNIATPSERTISFDVSSELSPKAGVTDVTTTIKIPYSALACRGDLAFRICDARVSVVIRQGSTRVQTSETEIHKSVPVAQFQDPLQLLTFDKPTTLSSGVYSIDVTVQDLNSGVTGTTTQPLFIP